MDSIRIAKGKRECGMGVLTAWVKKSRIKDRVELDEIFIRESRARGKYVQTVVVTRAELLKILALEFEPEPGTVTPNLEVVTVML